MVFLYTGTNIEDTCSLISAVDAFAFDMEDESYQNGTILIPYPLTGGSMQQKQSIQLQELVCMLPDAAEYVSLQYFNIEVLCKSNLDFCTAVYMYTVSRCTVFFSKCTFFTAPSGRLSTNRKLLHQRFYSIPVGQGS